MFPRSWAGRRDYPSRKKNCANKQLKNIKQSCFFSFSSSLWLLLFLFLIFKIIFHDVKPRLVTEWTLSTTREKNDSFLFPIVKEIIKRPQTSIFGKGIWGQVRSVWENVAIRQINFFIQSSPKRMSCFGILIHGRYRQKIVDAVDNSLKILLLAKLISFGIRKIIVWNIIKIQNLV